MVVGLATIAGNLIADLLYAAADPRVRYLRQ
jgi:ABC-type dipeptide/oligopeptide/nickel transport system permease component